MFKKMFLLTLVVIIALNSFTGMVYDKTDRNDKVWCECEVSATKNAPTTSAKAAFLYDCNMKAALYEKSGDIPLPMASTTKIMSALVAIENADLSKVVRVSESAIGTEGSSIYLKNGECMRLIDLVYAMLLSSANDASVAVAVEIAGSTESFAALMNDKALEMGLVNTHFTNPHGLDDKEHYTTARELAIITAYAMKNPIFKEIVSSYTKEITSEDGQKRLLVNHNRLLKSIDGCVGVKTGYTKRSGRSLVSAVERDGRMLVCVTINDPDDWRDHKRLIEYGFEMLNAE